MALPGLQTLSALMPNEIEQQIHHQIQLVGH